MTQQNLRHLTPAQVERFYLDGCLTVEDVLTPDEVAALAAHTDRIATGELEHISPTPASSSNPSSAAAKKPSPTRCWPCANCTT